MDCWYISAKTVPIFTGVLSVCCCFLSWSLAIPLGQPELHIDPATVHQIHKLTNRTWDFSDYAPGCKLMLGQKVLNKRNLVLSNPDAFKLLRLLHNEPFEDRMYVWAEIATLVLHETRKQGLQLSEISVEDLDKFEGDMVFRSETVDSVLSFYGASVGSRDNGAVDSEHDAYDHNRSKRLATVLEQFVWKETIQWKFYTNEFSTEQRDKVKQAINIIQDNTCVRFREIPTGQATAGAHIQFVKDKRCWAVIGRQTKGQKIALGDSCFGIGNILHELAHALGLLHQHTRPDRDRYISINITNSIDAKVFHNLLRSTLPWDNAVTLDIPYDLSSALHYSAYAFSQTGSPTINTKDPRMIHVIGQRESLSFLDIKFINTLYKCSAQCSKPSLEWDYCQNAGYRDPNNCNKCKCPKGFSPPNCARLSPAVNANCGESYLTATETEQQLISPGYPTGYPGNADCAWLIRAPSNHRVKLEFMADFDVQKSFPSCVAYVEIRYRNIARTGARYCSSSVPKEIFTSHGEEMMVLLHTKKPGHKGFQLTYKAEKCGGCSQNPSTMEPVCLKTELYDCPVKVPAICGFVFCFQERKNQCSRETAYCCSGFDKAGDICIRQPFGSGSGNTTLSP